MNAKLLGAEECQNHEKQIELYREVFSEVFVFEEQSLNHENIPSVHTGKIQPLTQRLEEENITHPVLKASPP